MDKIKKFNESAEEDKRPYIVLSFNPFVRLNKSTDEYLILKSRPIYDLKEITRTVKIINHQNMILRGQVGMTIEIEKHNFESYDELGIDVRFGWR